MEGAVAPESPFVCLFALWRSCAAYLATLHQAASRLLCDICAEEGAHPVGSPLPTSVPGLGSPLPTSAPGLPSLPPPTLTWAHPFPALHVSVDGCMPGWLSWSHTVSFRGEGLEV